MNLADHILFEDNHLLIVHKPSGLPVQGDSSGDTPLVDLAKSFIKHRDGKPGNVYMGLPHRLDRPTAGIVILCKTSKALARMNELFKKRAVDKTYWAVVGERPDPPAGMLEDMLWKDASKNRSTVVGDRRNGAKPARLSYRLLAESDRYHLLEVRPETGRHHQIRVQLAHRGWPIKGDVKYGFKRPNHDRSIHLLARSVRFVHPVRKEEMTVTAPVPDDVVWQAVDVSA